ncbi:MAG: SycD/LcrH family type III secretion system chaperone [Verrucomicrobia bacterium]|nr:SycD/LcrH family type III secretion system chaperone [Verrucomicrobiota bacterium]MBS0637240.1 SycD/LcrH family type III secretion system chaperone [Verrucomicrobiota bacterium]
MPKGGSSDFENVSVGKTVDATEGANKVAAGQIRETLQDMYKAVKQGIMPKQMLNMNDETLEGLYTQAYILYNQGKYQDASFIFVILVLLDPNQQKYQLGSAACLHRMGKYEKAAQIYLICSALDQSNPLPHFHAADCYIKINALPLAEMCLNNTIECCGQKKEYEVVKERALLMLTAVKQELAEMLKNQAQSEETEK